MEARPCQILEFFDGTKQLLVPLFQRPYEWGPREWEALWTDLFEQYERTEEDLVAPHFTGAIVTAPARSVPVGVAKYLVIDGQQRITTVAIILCAIRSLLQPDSKKYRKITKLLINEDDEALDYFKLLPTQPDREPFQSLIAEKPSQKTRFSDAFDFFTKKLKGSDSNDNVIDTDRLFETIQNRLTVVSIHLGETDDPYLIFESLNAKGAPLTQADLIRNYLLLRLHSSEQQKIYEAAWLPLQHCLGDHLTEFMRQFLMLTGEEVAKSAIYSVLKHRLLNYSEIAISSELHRMYKVARLYAQIIGISAAPEEIVAKRLARLRRWEVATANPFILKLMELYSDGGLGAAEVVACLDLIESFTVRRTICGVPTNQLKRIFLSATKDMPQGGVASWFADFLASGASGRRWPKDEEFEEALFRYRAYAPPHDRCKFILENLEETFGHKEPVMFSDATIEHVMPQTLTAVWQTNLGSQAEDIHEKWLDLLGNLTLTGYNPELSNSPFEEKRKLLADSHFEMNKWIANKETWTEVEMAERSRLLFLKAKAIWPRPGS
ncbi:DUF262 domain-containing protein [Methylocystis parvus]|uniref:DUF262 domain-containing protein n=1 Tax=Methylocystis parvus TaxID=134 RepID=UPI003C751B86